jgi:hypothetical protein
MIYVYVCHVAILLAIIIVMIMWAFQLDSMDVNDDDDTLDKILVRPDKIKIPSCIKIMARKCNYVDDNDDDDF